jgi:hypothetical protein
MEVHANLRFMRRLHVAISFGVLALATTASACESCAMYFDSASLDWCKYCRFSYCGYFACVVKYGPYGLEYCDSAWDVEGSDECFTDEGVLKGWCGPDPSPQARLQSKTTRSEWRLVRSRVLTPASRSKGLRG